MRHQRKIPRISGSTLLAAAALFGSGLVVVQTAGAADEKKPTVSKDLAKPLKAAQEAIQAKKYQEGIEKLKEAESNPKKTPYDEHIINELSAFAYARTNNYGEAAKALEAELKDGFLDQNDIPPRVKELTEFEYQLKNYDKSIEFGNQAIKGGYADDQIATIVGQSYYLKEDWKGASKFEEEQISSEIKKGTPPKEEQLKLAYSACVKLNDQDCVTKNMERLVQYYPQKDYWAQLLYAMANAQQNDSNMLQLYRLMFDVDVMKRPEEYTEMAQLAIERGTPGEAQHVLESALAKNVFTDPRSQDKNKRLLESAKKAAATDQSTLPKLQQDADAGSSGDKNFGVGLAYFGYQQYDKAADELTKAISKGNLKNDADAHLLLGISQLKTGHKEDAVKSFKAVKGDPFLERLANLWTLRAKQPGS